MEKLKQKEHDFSSKLRQGSVINRLSEYISWQRNAGSSCVGHGLPKYSPVSINLDLTSACNFSCPHCVDSKIINIGRQLATEDIMCAIDTLHQFGLLSVILLGGGEPTLHRDFEKIAGYIKSKGLQLGIVTNGSGHDKVKSIAGLLEKKDWVRISIDSARQNTFAKSHRPKTRITLQDILTGAREIKSLNPVISLGYSFVIVWDGIYVNGDELCQNVDEMSEAVRLGMEYNFDYISFKPCLLRLEDSKKESLFDSIEKARSETIIKDIKSNLDKANKTAGDGILILESVNLQALLKNEVHELKNQPKTCHMQFFNTVVTSEGIFHCPAFRGVDKAKIAERDGYNDKSKFSETLRNVTKSLYDFDAAKECSVVACFYHHANWWVENFVQSGKSIDDIAEVQDDNFFL